MNRKVILVLEDVESRIAWLREEVRVDNVVWVKSNAEFISFIERSAPEDISLMIFDHDLGRDKGIEAARFLSERFNQVPAIVWSMNVSGSISIVETLKGKGFVGLHLPFTDGNLEKLKTFVKAWGGSHD